MATKKTKTTAKNNTPAKKPKYEVTVNKYRRSYGSADFGVGTANTLTEARELAKKNTRNGDSYCISHYGKDNFRRENQVEKGTIYGSGDNKICKKGYTPHF